MAKVVGKIEALVGEVKILGVDGVLRDATVGEAIHAGEQIVSTDPGAQFEVKYLALEETSIYEGIFRVLADGSVIAGVDAMESIIGDEALMGLLETAAGEEGADGSSAYIPNDAIAESSVQGFSRGENQESGNNDDSDGDDNLIIDTNDFEPTAQDGTNVATEDDLADVTGQLVGADLDGDAFEFVLVDDLGEGEGTVTLNSNGSYVYNVDGDFQDLRIGETRDVTFTYKTVETTTPEGYESEPATVTITVTGTNDQPIVEDIDVNGEQTWLIGASTIPQGGENQGENGGYYDIDGASLEDINALFSVGEDSVVVDDLDPENGEDYNPIDGAAMKFIMDVEAGESITFNWTFNDAEGYDEGEGEDGFRDFAFVVVDGVSIELLADTFEDGTTNTGTFTYTFQDGGQHEITFGVMNDDDEIVDSSLEISHISGGNIVDTQSVGHVENIGNDAIIYETHDTIDITGEDDTQGEDGNNILTGTLSVFDLDTNDVNDINDTHIFEVVGEVSIVNPENVDITAGREGEEVDVKVSITFNEGTQEWEYKINGDFSELAAGETSTLTFDYVAIDNSDDNIADYIGDNVDDQPAPNESDTSDAKTITLTITGTNDQPVAQAQTYGDTDAGQAAIYETHDNDAYQDGEDNTSSETDDGTDGTTTLSGTLSATDDDTNNTHMFNVLNMQGNATQYTSSGILNNNFVDISYDDGIVGNDNDVTVKIESSDIDVDNITLESITLSNDNSTDSDVGFDLVGNFNALAAGETATVTFMYNADDQEGFGTNDANHESSISEPKSVTITITGTNDQPVIQAIDIRDALEYNLASKTYSTDTDVDLSVIAQDAKEGSAYTFVLDTDSNDVLTFDWTFSSDDALPDAAAVIIDGVIVATFSTTDTSGTFSTADLDSSIFDGFTTGEHTITIVAVNNRLDDSTSPYSAIFTISNIVTDGVIISDGETDTDKTFGNVTGSTETGTIVLDANSNEINGLDDFIDSKEVTYEDAHFSGSIEMYESAHGEDNVAGEDGIFVTDDDNNDDYTYVAFKDKIVDAQNITENTSGTDLLITTPVRVSLDENGNYDVVSSSFDKLGKGESVTITFDIQVKDTSDSIDAIDDLLGDNNNEAEVSEPKTVTLTIHGTNDAPVLVSVSSTQAEFMETELAGNTEHSLVSGQLTREVTDEDVNDDHIYVAGTPTATIESDESNLIIESDTTVTVNADGTYTIENPAFNNMGVDESVEISFMVQVQDDSGVDNDNLVHDETSLSNFVKVTVTINGTNDQPTVENVSITHVEATDASATSINGTFSGDDEDTNDSLTYGAVTMGADVNAIINDVEGLSVSDYVRFDDVNYYSDVNAPAQSINIAVKLPTGEYDASDIVITGITVNGGSYTLEGDFDALPDGEVLTIKFLYNATDDSGAIVNPTDESAVSDNAMATITITGTNDVANITAHIGHDEGVVQEDSVVQIEEGYLEISDLDAGEAEFNETFVSGTVDSSGVETSNTTSYGTFEIDTAGYWKYTLNNDAAQSLSEDDVITEIFTVSSEDGSDTQEITITIHGTNDGVSITSEVTSGSVTEDDATPDLTDFGVISFTDVDLTDTHMATVTDTSANPLGALTFDPIDEGDRTVTWTYTVANADVQYLADGELKVETFDVTISDGNGGTDTQKVFVTITGTNDAPTVDTVISDANTDEDALYTYDVSGHFADVDLLDTLTFSAEIDNGDSTTSPLPTWLTISATGVLSGTPANGDVGSYAIIVIANDGLATVSDTYTLTVDNVNDAPVITLITGSGTTVVEDDVIDGTTTEATVLVDVDVTDVDGPVELYTITSGNDDGYFEINNDGEITLTVHGETEIAASHVNDETFTLGVEVSDGSLTDSTTVTIHVDDDAVDIPTINLLAAFDSGDNSDNITNTPTLNLGNIAADVLTISVIENSVLQAQATRSSISAAWIINNAGDGSLSYDSGANEWLFTADSTVADGEHTYSVVVVDDAGNEAVSLESTLVIDTTAPAIDTSGIADNVNETLSDVDLGQVTATDANGPVTLTVSSGFMLDIDGNLTLSGEIDYEDDTSHTVTITATDAAGNIATQDVTVNVNDITGTVLYTSAQIMQTFDGNNAEGWTGQGAEHHPTNGVLGWFDQDSDTRSQTFDLSDSAGESANISFDLGIYGILEGYNLVNFNLESYGEGWEGNDTFRVRVTDSDGNTIELENFSPDGNYTASNMIGLDFDIDVPQDGEITVEFKSVYTDDYGVGLEAWSIDNFQIDGESREVLSFDTDGTIDVEALVAQANDFENDSGVSVSNPNSLDEIDLTAGNHTLLNITLADVITMTDDNTLKITGDSADGVDLTGNNWEVDTTPAVTESGYTTYTNTADSSVQLLIDVDIQITAD